MIKALSHLVIATADVARICAFFESAFGLAPYFKVGQFAEFVLPSRARIAFFVPVGKSAQFFGLSANRESVAYGVTVGSVEAVYEKVVELGATVSGPPKEHPWGEKSFLLIDPDGNRWEVTESPSEDGMLTNR